jgi:hypothetical protein
LEQGEETAAGWETRAPEKELREAEPVVVFVEKEK